MFPFGSIDPPSDINWYRYVTLFAASSAVTTLVTHPIDTIRVQMQSQLNYISPRLVIKHIVRYRGLLGVYFGFISAIEKEFSTCWLRFAFYEHARSRGKIDSFWRRIMYASASGFLGGVLSTPLTKVGTRIRADAAKAPKKRYDYADVFHGLREIYREGGFKSFFSMVRICGLRGLLMTTCQLAVYDQVKASLSKELGIYHEWQRYLVASAIACSVTIFIITPFDVVEQIGHTLHIKHFCGEKNIICTIARLQGIRGFYKGTILNIMRIPPQTMLTFLIYDQLNAKLPKIS